MEGIDTRVVCHFLAINPSVKSIAQRKQKIGEEKRIAIDEKVSILASAGFIIEIKHNLDRKCSADEESNK